MGVSVEVQEDRPAADVLEILPQNWASFQVWMAVQTQWRVAAGMGGIVWLGLDYGAVGGGVGRRPPEGGLDGNNGFAGLRGVEAEALATFAEGET